MRAVSIQKIGERKGESLEQTTAIRSEQSA